MKIGWLADPGNSDGTLGGAELTMQEFARAAPSGVEIVPCLPGAVSPELDRYVVGNHLSYSDNDLIPLRGRVVRYAHDMRSQRLRDAAFIFCSPLQHERFPLPVSNGDLIPPAIDLPRFHGTVNGRSGTCCIGAFQNPGKGGHLVAEWADANEPVDYYGMGAFGPAGANINEMGVVPYEQIPQILHRYERFVFLPTALEPFGRAVVEAWAAGCELIINRNVGARFWIEEKPEKLETAAEDFWHIACG